ncbi:MAG: prolipoprotein diacylglyceryl transferase [Bacteroidales bacterium]|jgi:prolipoprotein diacylglyceryl transferase|nr:prolipoprotein diacylglyceryl transferase [Bacteroidales bacterium]MDD4085909.1 prolipoprotein diacylglyceryl transferase [Bacteroidales bacterium]MDY0085035.1 prolipoprotein diacylglyceryl transferase [Bacteroidales bacterium]
MLNFIVWNVSPEIFSFPDWLPLLGGRGVRWYGALFAASFVVGYYIMQKIFEREKIGIKVLDQLSTYMIVATVVGARLGHCLFYEPAYYLANPIEILKVWEGGLASHGAAIGIIIALYFFSRKQQKTIIWTLDRVVIVVALAGFFIRTGNLMNSEIFGHITTLPWGFEFVRASDPVLRTDPRHPTQLYEGIFYLATFFFLYRSYFKKNMGQKQPGYIFGIFLIAIFGSRLFIEFLKEPQVGFEADMTLNMGQWLSIPFIIGGIVIWYKGWKKHAV